MGKEQQAAIEKILAEYICKLHPIFQEEAKELFRPMVAEIIAIKAPKK